jgi:nucleotide sugar dehydrogenase
MDTTGSTTSATFDPSQAARKKALSSRVPLEAPDSPPPTPPEFIETGPYFSQSVANTALQPHSPPTVAVIGTGYVGLHLVEAFSTAYPIIAFDVSEKRILEVHRILSTTTTTTDKNNTITCTSDPTLLATATHFLISVSTILHPSTHEIDISCIEAAISTVARYAQPSSTIIIESSVAVGMTRRLLSPLLLSDKCLLSGMSPERVDPGRTEPTYTQIPKIISGLNAASLRSIQNLYAKVFKILVPVSSPEVAEMTKLYENCQRMMCIAFANEMADACHSLSSDTSNAVVAIDPFEVARTAATKPFGYQPYTPSLGVGGHCIPVNPYYLLSTAAFPLLEACTKRMEGRPARMGNLLMRRLTASSLRLTGSGPVPRILVVGMGFKRVESVVSNSPGVALADYLLRDYAVWVEFADPLVEQSVVPSVRKLREGDWKEEVLGGFDAVVVVVDQVGLDWGVLERMQARGRTLVEWWCRR